jgi:pimeloyl-ACP methyl ester carboxylesterase
VPVGRSRVVIVPGVAVRAYAREAADALRQRGFDAVLLPGPGQPGAGDDLEAYAENILPMLLQHEPDVLVGLSVGTQAAALLARRRTELPLRHLVLVGPTVDPQARSTPRLLAKWAKAGTSEPPRLSVQQLPDWREAGGRRIAAVLRSALDVRLEDVLTDVDAQVTVIHAERDAVTSHGYAAWLAADSGRSLIVVPDATHSWPYADESRFATTMEELVA